MMHTYSNLLLSLFLVSAGLMLLTGYCVFRLNKLARKFLGHLYEFDMDAYRKMLGNREVSWIERRTDSILDFSLWWRLYRVIYRDGEGEYAIDSGMQRRFVNYVRVMLASFATSISIVGLAFVIGLVLATS